MRYDAKVAPYIHRERMRRRGLHCIGIGILMAVALVLLQAAW